MKTRIVTSFLLLSAGFAAACLPGFASPRPAPIASGVWPIDKVEGKTFPWGELKLCHLDAETHGVKNCLVGYVTLKPGQENHPPHQHAEEEFMALVEGEGTWSLNGKPVAAKKGDVVYAAPWDFHGLKNTGDKPCTFFVVKWGYKGVLEPPKK